MNAKQIIPVIAIIARVAPPLLLGVAIFSALKWLLSDDTEKKVETQPVDIGKESRRKEAEAARENRVFRNISAEIHVKPAAAPVPSAPRVVVSPQPFPTEHKIISPTFTSAFTTQPRNVVQPAPPPPIKKPGILWDDMAKVFRSGALTRQAAVAALKKLGFGQTAAYAALLPDGRFSAWLHFTPNGTITWKG